MAAPTATPAFPEARITEATLDRLRPLRSVGFGEAADAAISPGNRLLAVATTAGVAIFELPSLRHLRFDPIDSGVYRIAFADEQTLALATGAVFEPHERQTRRVSDGALLSSGPAELFEQTLQVFSPDQRLVASFNVPDSSPTPGVRLNRVADGGLLYHDDWTVRVSFSPDSSLIALVAYDGTLRLIDRGGKSIGTLEIPGYWSVAFSPDGQNMVTAGRAVWVWDAVSGELRQMPSGLAVAGDSSIIGAEQNARFSPDGRLLTVEGSYTVFEATLRRGSTWAIGGSAADSQASGEVAGARHAWDTDAGGLGVINYETYGGAISPATNATAKTDDGVELIVAQGDTPPATLTVPAGVGALAFSPDGVLLAVGDKAGAVQIVQVSDRATARTMQGAAGLTTLRFSPDGALLGGRGGSEISVWSVADGALVARIALAPTDVALPAGSTAEAPFIFTPDSAMLITWGKQAIHFYGVGDGQLLHRLATPAQQVAIGPRQRLLGVLSGRRVELWGIP
jgi:WD40 repeat protein